MQQTILMHPPPDGTPASRHVECLADALGGIGVEVKALTLRNLLTDSGAVLHVHWPEHLLGHPSAPKSLARLIRGVLMVGLARVRKQPIVWTAHNIEPHGGWPIGSRPVARWLRSIVAGVVVLCEGQESELLDQFPELTAASFMVLPEGRLHDGPALPPSAPGDRPVRLVHLGVLIPYKGHLDVIEGLAPHLAAGRVELRIVGRSGGDEYSDEVQSLASSTEGLEFVGRRVSEEELLGHLEWCDAAIGVQNPAFNSGIPAAFLPLGRRVILSASTQADFLQASHGPDWVLEIDDPRSPASWETVLERLRIPPLESIDPAVFSWRAVAEEFKEFVGSFVAGRR